MSGKRAVKTYKKRKGYRGEKMSSNGIHAENRILKVVLIGAGMRGETYTGIMKKMSDKYKVIAVAEPIDSRRNAIREAHQIPGDMCFKHWNELLSHGKIADMAIIATMDRQHFEPAMKAISLGYDILLEKPVAPTPEECLKVALYAQEKQVKAVVCHVLRYTPLFMTIKNMIDSGKLGDIISINHEECVGNVHQSHSFVRGNWGNEGRSACMLLAKSCHDIDLLQWLINKKCKRVQSFGNLTYFREKNMPKGAPEYCIEGCPNGDVCPYNAVKLYLEDKDNTWFRSACTREAEPSDETVEQAIRTTSYGKCVFRCDNDVVDHQTVNMLFEDDITVTFTMNAFNKGGRYIHIMGTKGELYTATDKETPIRFYDFETCDTVEIPITAGDGIVNGHGGGDEGIIVSLYEYLTDQYQGNSISDIRISSDNHLIVFAAEESRKNGTVVDFEKYVEHYLSQ